MFDVTDPTEPTIIGALGNSQLTDANDVVVRGRYAYVIDQSNTTPRLSVVDVSNPVHPQVVGSVLDAVNLEEGYWLKLVGNYVFVATKGSNALTVVNVSDPTDPQVVATHSDPSILGEADGIDVAGNTAYVAAFCTTPNLGCSTPTTGALSAFDVTPYTGLDFTRGPLADDSSNQPEFSFTTSEGSTTCSLDGAAAVPCTSPFIPSSPLAAGQHSLTVSTAAHTATWAWTIDAPTVTSPKAGSTSTEPVPVFQGVAGTRPGDLSPVAVALYSGSSVGGSPLQSMSAESNAVSGAYSAAASSALAPGTYTVPGLPGEHGRKDGKLAAGHLHDHGPDRTPAAPVARDPAAAPDREPAAGARARRSPSPTPW